ncbi:MAG: beta-lactamase family protein [Sphingomonadales bacterium]|nr:beta-lactamase family protein [Sphingomonadales bacterium]
MMLYEEGKWKLDDPITRVPAGNGQPQGHFWCRCLRQADHRAGQTPADHARADEPHAGFGYGLLGRNPVDDMFRARAVNGSKNLAEVAAKGCRHSAQVPARRRLDYSIAVDLQARIVEVITGENYGAYLQRRVLGPLGMTGYRLPVPAEKVGRFADLYGLDPKSGKIVPLPPTFAPNFNFTDPNRQQSGGGGLVSTASDYGRFCQMILNGGKLGGVRLLKPETIALMGQDVIPQGVRPDNGLVGGMGTTAFAFGPGVGFGLDFMVIKDPKSARLPVGKARSAGASSWNLVSD